MRSLLPRRSNANNTPQSQGVTRSAGVHRATKSGCFDLLARELVHQIAAWLPPSSAASLALCSRTILHILGTQHLLRIRPGRLVPGAQGPLAMEEGALFLRGLDRDLPAASSFYCYHCHKIHLLFPRKRVIVSRGKRYVPGLWTLNSERLFMRVFESLCEKGLTAYNAPPNSNAHIRVVYHDQFVFEHVQMAMKLHREGASHLLKSYLQRLSLTNKEVTEMSFTESYNGFHFFEPRIVDHQMVVRAQSWIVMPSYDRVNVHNRFRLPDNLCNTTVCAHLDLRWGQANRLTKILCCRLGHARYQTPSPCINCEGNLRCPMCPTEIEVDIKPFADEKARTRGIVLVITRWQLVGDGTSPFEKHWAHRLHEECDPWPWLESGSLTAIKDAFENQSGTKWDSILSAGEAWKLMRRASQQRIFKSKTA